MKNEPMFYGQPFVKKIIQSCMHVTMFLCPLSLCVSKAIYEFEYFNKYFIKIFGVARKHLAAYYASYEVKFFKINLKYSIKISILIQRITFDIRIRDKSINACTKIDVFIHSCYTHIIYKIYTVHVLKS